MSLPAWNTDATLGKVACTTPRESWCCLNMVAVEGDLDMSFEHYECKLCGKTVALDYDEMR